MSRTAVRELKRGERKRVREFAHANCANYDRTYRCCPLLGDYGCYMDGVVFPDTGLCKYFREAVLPLDRNLENLLLQNAPTNLRKCPVCGTEFPATGRRVCCSQACAYIKDKKGATRRMRKSRKNEE